ncbi:MAG: glycosyltransferase family 4 protein [Xanthomonadaceae bacterium]|nr:glycosyltransferase family 4 protein [Xanthomonadaceae bacterium]MDP2186300.1 glycosyltransferase family 4 protein [Xanthomonadales bacterium]MDZ4115801.1 glycosyltransferase family 4 protein [Xanthomonadaceae bacterium]MDZ4377167.1 glycosyltransferase family 4 protein [Xanthomonadaceae bacterium]
MSESDRPDVCLIGHPFAPIGRGEDVRCSFRALRAVALRPSVLDLYGHQRPDADAEAEFGPFLTARPGAINIFHLNGDEVRLAFATLTGTLPEHAYNIVYPAWELAKYPPEWAQQLDRFDEIWAPSSFIKNALLPAVQKPVVHMPLACEVVLSAFRSRRYFGIPEAAYAFLFFFDFRSFATRKNPQAAIRAFAKLCQLRPSANTCLVIKVHGAEAAPDALAELQRNLAQWRGRVVLINQQMDDNDTKNLLRCCDCFVSLHRSEGFGRGLAEAMYLGKPVIATRYSGNLDFMDERTAYLVEHTLVPVQPGEYPHAEGQQWADADVEQAADYMAALVDDPARGYAIGRNASCLIRTQIGWRASGMRYRERIEVIAELQRKRVAQGTRIDA